MYIFRVLFVYIGEVLSYSKSYLFLIPAGIKLAKLIIKGI